MESRIFGIYDRLWEHGHCSADVVLAPAKPDGEPDWENADPANVSSLPHDLWPDDSNDEKRACVIVSNIDGCDPESSFIVTLHHETGIPGMFQIHGPSIDRDVADSIVGRDLGNRPPPKPPSALAASMEKLTESLRKPVAANDNTPAASSNTVLSDLAAERAAHRKAHPLVELPELPAVFPSAWQGAPIPDRQWWLSGMVPMKTVTMLSGDGGLGKSLIAIQWGVASAIGAETVGLVPAKGRVLYVAAEDELDEFHRRIADTLKEHDAAFDDLAGDFLLIPLADRDATLAAPDKSGAMVATPLMTALIEKICEFQPQMIVLDTSADLYGGDEIKRPQVRQFISMLRQIAIKLDCAVLLLSHPSVSGMEKGTGTSGSTAWNNSVRSRLYLTSETGEGADPDGRVLSVMKANYGAKGNALKIRWRDGVFIQNDGRPSPGNALIAAKAERVLRELLSAINRTGERVAKTKGLNYAPKIMAEHPDADGVTVKQFEAAMQRLLAAGDIKIVFEGPPSKQRQRLILTAEDFGPQD
ncbi:AAA family ATPase [Rhizobium sp. 2YAF20]|uniref:AAA family ATPase n=1 Tax=Rhizobium sp. 2YAF20 TaxID=3233027 RepID=UPI003F9501CD